MASVVAVRGRVATSVNGRVVKHQGEGSYFGALAYHLWGAQAA